MNKKIIKVVIMIVIAFVILVSSVLVSMAKFAVINPFATSIGMFKILCTSVEYTVVQNNPYRVVFSKPKYNEKIAQELLDEYMKDRGFEQENRNGSITIYTNGNDEEKIHLSVNRYYSIWEWI